MTRPFERIASEVGRLVTEKNEAYGDSAATSGKALELLYPDGLKPEAYGDALLLVRIWDKLKRIATRKNYAGESPYRDIAGYGLLGAAKDEDGEAEGRAVQAAESALTALAAAKAEENALAEATCRFAGLSPAHARELLARGVVALPTPVHPRPRAFTAAEREALEAIARARG
jgi:hypothetical protein